MTDHPDTLFEFPCEFPIKAMGEAHPYLDAKVVEIVRRHAPEIREGSVTTRASRGGRYLSVTVTITAHSRDQLDAIYRELNADERILMTL